MNSSKEFFEKLTADEAFSKEICEKAKEKYEAGEQDYKALWISLAAEYGYELSGEELDELREAATAELSEEELGKVSGGTTIICMIAIPVITSGAAVTLYLTKESRNFDKV